MRLRSGSARPSRILRRRGAGNPGFAAPLQPGEERDSYKEWYVFILLPGAWASCPRRRDEGGTPSLPGAWVTPGVNSYNE